jgi:hypothetical protein
MNAEPVKQTNWPKVITVSILSSYGSGLIFLLCWLASVCQVRAFFVISMVLFSVGFMLSTFIPLLILIEVSSARTEMLEKMSTITSAVKLLAMNGRK